MKPKYTIFKLLTRNLVVLLAITVSAVGAYATLGDGKIKRSKPSKSLLTNKTVGNNFSLRSGYHFRGAEVFNSNAERYINLNTVLTYKRGNTSYILPMKKTVLLDKVKIDISNRQLRRN